MREIFRSKNNLKISASKNTGLLGSLFSLLSHFLASKKLLVEIPIKWGVGLAFVLLFSTEVKADYTINLLDNIDPKNTPDLLNAKGTISIYGTMNISSDVSFSSTDPLNILIYGPSGQIYWSANKNLTLPAGSTITFVSNPTAPLGLQPISGNASQVLVIGDIKYAASNDNSNNVIYSFFELNNIGGTAKVRPTINPTPVCFSASLNFLSNRIIPSGDIIKLNWSVDPVMGVFSPNNSSMAANTILSGITANSYRNTYKVTCDLYSDAGNNNFFLAATNSIVVKFSNVWTGIVSSDWNEPNNWSDGKIPTTTCSTVYIPNTPNQPVLSTAPDGVITNLVIDAGAKLTVSNATLKIGGTITNSGIFDVSSGSLDFNGISPQNISGNLFLGNSIKNLTLSNATGLTVSGSLGSLIITGDLAFGNVNNASLNTGDNIVLASTATATGRVTDITNNGVNSGNKFSGKVTVERYFPARRAWRLITAPVSGAGSVFSNWQNNGIFASGKGTYVTGPGANLLSNGMDPSSLNNTSLKMGSALSPVNNTLTSNLSTATGNADNKGFFIFVRGDRTANNLNINYCNSTTLQTLGDLQTGNQQFAGVASAGAFTLIGNPYAAPVDFSKLIRTNINNRFYAWDPYLGSDQGGYVVLDDINNTGSYTVSPASPAGQTKLIQSGQAIFVETSIAESSSIKFIETAKTFSNLQGAFRPVNNDHFLRTNLYLLNDNGSSSLADGNLVEFDDRFNAGIDGQDAIKLGNVKETIAFTMGGNLLAINRRPLLFGRDTLYLHFSNTTQRKYQFQLLAGKLQQHNLAGFIEDQYLNKLTPMNMDGTTNVDFEVTSSDLSAASNRFRVLFGPSVSFTNINASLLENDVSVQWQVGNEYNIKTYDIERSSDGVVFTKLDSTMASGNGEKAVSYTWLDRKPLPGNYYYRIRSLSNNNVVAFSEKMKVKINHSGTDLYVFPNPVSENNIQIQMNGMPSGVYLAKLFNGFGQLMGSSRIRHLQKTATENIQFANRLVPGIYQLEITLPNQKNKRISIVVQ